MLTTQEIRDLYLSNQLFLMGEKFGGYEVIDRRSNYIVVVDGEGKDKRMFLEEAYLLTVPPAVPAIENTPAQPTISEQSALKKGANGLSFSSFSAVLSEGVFTYKGFRGTNISKNRECEQTFMTLAEECADPWALLSAVRAVDAFFEHRTAGTLERARIAVSRVDDIANHPWLLEDVEGPVATSKSIFTIQPAIEVLDEDLDFAIEEKLTYNGFKIVLTEAFEHDVGRALSKLEKNPSLLDELASSLRSINDIAHHYDKHSVHMSEDIEKAVEHAEKTKKITLRKTSSGPQVIKIAKRAAVELIAQKLAGKPVKKISKKEKNVIVDAIKKKKGVVMKLVKKLVPKIKAIEAGSAEHEHESEEFGSAGS